MTQQDRQDSTTSSAQATDTGKPTQPEATEVRGENLEEMLLEHLKRLEKKIDGLRAHIEDVECRVRSVQASSRYGSAPAYVSDVWSRANAFREGEEQFQPRSPFSQ